MAPARVARVGTYQKFDLDAPRGSVVAAIRARKTAAPHDF